MMDRHVDQESITSFAIFLHAACFISATTMFFSFFSSDLCNCRRDFHCGRHCGLLDILSCRNFPKGRIRKTQLNRILTLPLFLCACVFKKQQHFYQEYIP